MLLPNLDLFATAPYGVAKLRELILTLAVQGKLVPQDASDEPASMLLKKIRAEKDRLVAEGKIKYDKPLAAISEAEKPFELPEAWRLSRLDDMAIAIVDCPHSTPTFIHHGLLCIDTNSFKSGRLVQHKLRYVSASTFAERILRLQPEPGDLVFAREGSVGESVIIPAGTVACLGQRVMLFRFSRHVSNEFIRMAITSKWFLDGLLELHKGIGAKHVNVGDMRRAVIPIPPLAEQSRIVARVEELMRLCDALEAKGHLEATQHAQLVATLLAPLTASTTPEELAENWQRVATHFDLLLDRPEAVDALAQTILQLAVRGLLVPQDPTDEPASEQLKKIRTEKDRLITEGKIKRDKPLPPIADDEAPFELPQGWEWTRMQTAFDVRDGTHDTPKYVEGDGFPLITSKNFENGKINFKNAKLISASDHESIMKRSKVERNDFLYSMIGGNIGNQVIVDIDREFSIKNVALFKCVSAVLTQPHYLHLFLETATLTMQQRAVGGAQPFVSLSLLRNIPFPLPPAAEQSRIVARVASLRALCAQLRKKLTDARDTQSQLAEALVEAVA